MILIKLAFSLLILSLGLDVNAMTPWDHFEVGGGYVEAELENTENNDIFNYGGQYYNLYYNHLRKVKNNWHHYYGLNFQYLSMSNNADNGSITEKATHLSPGLHYKIYYNNIFANFGYNYVMAEHEGSGARTTNLDFDIHKASLKLGYDYPLSDNLYLMGAYNFSYGLTTGLDDDHIYSEHIFSLNFVIKFGGKPASDSTSGKSSSGGSSSRGRGYKNIKVDKRNSLYDFFIITD